jgi:hypothetical protein
MFHKSHYTFARKVPLCGIPLRGNGRMEEWKDMGLLSIYPSNLPFFQKM